jgi:hypothetical protein
VYFGRYIFLVLTRPELLLNFKSAFVMAITLPFTPSLLHCTTLAVTEGGVVMFGKWVVLVLAVLLGLAGGSGTTRQRHDIAVEQLIVSVCVS